RAGGSGGGLGGGGGGGGQEVARPAWMPVKSPGTRHPRVPGSVTKYVARRHLDGSTAAGRPPDRRSPRGGGDDDERDRPARHREGEAAARQGPRGRTRQPQRQRRA